MPRLLPLLMLTSIAACEISEQSAQQSLTSDCSQASAAIALESQIRDNDGAHASRFPIVLAHGAFGFDRAGFFSYWGRSRDTLRAAGYAVYVTRVEPVASSANERGPALAAQIACIVAQTGAGKVNIVGHSQGGLDARVVAHIAPQHVASVTTISTPHRGTILADAIVNPGLEIAAPVTNGLADVYAALVGAPTSSADVVRAARELSEDGARQFNATFPDINGIPYFSWAGRTGRSIFSSRQNRACSGATRGNPRARDIVNPSLYLAFEWLSLWRGANDGVVTVESARWGNFQGCVAADHVDQTGVLGAFSTNFTSGYRHTELFMSIADDLARAGL